MTKYKVHYEIAHAPDIGEVTVDAKSTGEARREFTRLEEDDTGKLILNAANEDPNHLAFKIVSLEPIK